MKSAWFLLVAAVFINGCATTPVNLSTANKVPNERVFAFQVASNKNTAELTVIRDKGLLGSACYLSVYVNTVLSARIDVAEAVTFYLRPGEILLRAGKDPEGKGLCGGDQGYWTQREITLKAGQIKSFRLSLNQGGTLDIMRADM